MILLRRNQIYFLFFCVWVALCGLLGLAGYQWWLAHHKSPKYVRFLMWSSPNFSRDENGAVHYTPNQDVREVAVYNDKIEYDARYHTNNLGLIDNLDYAPNTLAAEGKNFAFVGDSFTAGSGAAPWVPLLRDKLQKKDGDLQIYNLGVSGTGFLNFEKLLESSSKYLKFSHIFILAISSDFTRGHWWPLVKNDELRFCAEGVADTSCLRDSPMATIIPLNASKKEIFKHLADQPHQSKVADSEPPKMNPLSQMIRQTVNSVALDNIRNAFPGIPITLIQLPQKEEVISGAYLVDGGKIVRPLKIDYYPALKNCSWNTGLFYPHDPHPNEKGYRAISACVEKYLVSKNLILSDKSTL